MVIDFSCMGISNKCKYVDKMTFIHNLKATSNARHYFDVESLLQAAAIAMCKWSPDEPMKVSKQIRNALLTPSELILWAILYGASQNLLCFIITVARKQCPVSPSHQSPPPTCCMPSLSVWIASFSQQLTAPFWFSAVVYSRVIRYCHIWQ